MTAKEAIKMVEEIRDKLEEEFTDDWYYPVKRTRREYHIRQAAMSAQELCFQLAAIDGS
jgi:hypothetical protein